MRKDFYTETINNTAGLKVEGFTYPFREVYPPSSSRSKTRNDQPLVILQVSSPKSSPITKEEVAFLLGF